MKKLSLAACAAMIFQVVATTSATAQEAVPPTTTVPITPAPQATAPQTPNESMPNIDRMPVARRSQVQDDLEGRGLIGSAIGPSSTVPGAVGPQNGVLSSVGSEVVREDTVVESTVAAPAIVATRKLMVVPPIIVDMMIGDTLVIGPGPGFGYGLGPGLPLDEISVLPELTVAACSCVSMPVPNACEVPAGAELRAVLMIGNHMQVVAVEQADPCLLTITLPRMWMSGAMRATVLVGLNTGDVLYEQPMLMTLPQG